MPGTSFERVIHAFEDAGCNIKMHGSDRASAQAPGHGPKDLSVSVMYSRDRTLVYSHSDDTDAVLEAVGLEMRDLFDNPCGVDYPYSGGRLVHRTPDKQFPQSGNKSDRSLYRVEHLPEDRAAVVYVTEGEQCADALAAIGTAAVSPAQGASTAADRFDWTPLSGRTVLVVQDKDEAGRKHARDVANQLQGIAADVVIVEAAEGKDAADHVTTCHGPDEFVPVTDVPAELSVVRLSEVVAERVSWLWPGRLPAGKLVTLDGDPGLGKSTLALTFAAVVTNGGIWPDGTRCEYRGGVILLSAEDGLADTIRPRLDAAGADVTRVHAVQGVVLENGTLRPPTLDDVDQLERLVTRTAARLLVIDVLMAYLPSGTDSHKDQDIRRVLSRLAGLADRTGCTVLLLRHLNKAKGGDPMYRGGGSIGIVGAARAGVLVAKDPDDEDVRVMACTKSNLGPAPEALTYRLVNVDDLGVARVEWTGTSTHDARALLADTGGDDGDERREVEVWLYDLLASNGAALPAAAVFKSARAAGYSTDQAKRAKRKLNVTSTKATLGSGWTWNLPEGSTEGNEGSGSQNGASFAPFPLPSESLPSDINGPAAPDTDDPDADPPAEIRLCNICSEPCPSTIRAHVDCALQQAERNHGYLPKTPGAEVGVWMGSGTRTMPEASNE